MPPPPNICIYIYLLLAGNPHLEAGRVRDEESGGGGNMYVYPSRRSFSLVSLSPIDPAGIK